MAEELNNIPSVPTEPIAPVEIPRAESSGHIDPEAYYALQRQLQEQNGVLERLAPHADRIKRLVEDEAAASLFDNTLSAYEQMQRAKEPEVPSELAPLDARLKKIEEVADAFLAERKAAQEAPERERKGKYDTWLNESKQYGQRLVQEHPELNENGGAAWTYLENIAKSNDYEPLEKVWKREGKRFIRESGESAPPSSLRADTGDAGIPGPSTEARDPNTPIDFRKELLKRLAKDKQSA